MSKLENIIKKHLKAISESEMPEQENYMFFGNIEQMKRQCELLMNEDKNEIDSILKQHDWAQDHIAEAKSLLDQVFDFLMNQTKGGDSEIDESLLSEQPFNDGGEPMMTHQQYRDYSEPAEPDDDDYGGDVPNNDTAVGWLRNELEENNIFLENYGGDEYMISCEKVRCDFMIYFDNKNDIETSVKIYIYNGDTNEEIEQRFVDVIEAFNFILSVKDKYQFQSYESAVRDYVKSQRDDAMDRYNNRMERGSFD